MIRALTLSAILMLPTTAFADKAAADACARGLSQEAKIISDAALPQVTPTAVLQDVLTTQTRGLVGSGKVQRSSARDSATSAGACLQKLR